MLEPEDGLELRLDGLELRLLLSRLMSFGLLEPEIPIALGVLGVPGADPTGVCALGVPGPGLLEPASLRTSPFGVLGVDFGLPDFGFDFGSGITSPT
jgi:hypothetical protein